MNSSNIWQWSAVKTSEAVKNKKISAEDAVQSAIDRMDEVNEKVNAVVVDLREEALIKAKQIDEKILRNEDIGILSGVPITDGLVKSQRHQLLEKIGCSEHRVLKGTRVSNGLMTPKSDCILHPVDFLRVHQG